jgi:hypothetical protein
VGFTARSLYYRPCALEHTVAYCPQIDCPHAHGKKGSWRQHKARRAHKRKGTSEVSQHQPSDVALQVLEPLDGLLLNLATEVTHAGSVETGIEQHEEFKVEENCDIVHTPQESSPASKAPTSSGTPMFACTHSPPWAVSSTTHAADIMSRLKKRRKW